ncbi:MAG: InlB B-repeat-containing protein [Clostridiales bacterium]|nr:InlB B-repeat-containing protein [Clostridiales bacterium]
MEGKKLKQISTLDKKCRKTFNGQGGHFHVKRFRSFFTIILALLLILQTPLHIVASEDSFEASVPPSAEETLPPDELSEEEPPVLFTLTYDENGEGFTGVLPVDETQYPKGSLITLPEENPAMTREGFIFKGWALTSDSITQAPVATFVLDQDTVLYALWAPLEEPAPEPELPHSEEPSLADEGIVPMAEEETVASVFLDPAIAKAVANQLTGGNVDAPFPTDDLWKMSSLSVTYATITTFAGIERLRHLTSIAF